MLDLFFFQRFPDPKDSRHYTVHLKLKLYLTRIVNDKIIVSCAFKYTLIIHKIN